jgi:hypothetical protein
MGRPDGFYGHWGVVIVMTLWVWRLSVILSPLVCSVGFVHSRSFFICSRKRWTPLYRCQTPLSHNWIAAIGLGRAHK